MSTHVADQWQQRFVLNGLDSFDAIWNLDIGWFEEPNQRRGGWSGVSRMDIEDADGNKHGIFIKRQENHSYKSFSHPFGELTFVREFNNIKAYHKAGVPTLDVIYFSDRTSNGNRQAILISKELTGYQPLDDFLRDAKLTVKQRRNLASTVANAIRQLHYGRFQHNCLYPKHLFVKIENNTAKASLIDLEKTKRRLLRQQAVYRDLDTLNRHSLVSNTDRLRFLLAYMQKNRVDGTLRQLWLGLKRKSHSKQRRS